MRVLLVHQNFPGQYRDVAPALAARPDTEVVALGINPAPALPEILRRRPRARAVIVGGSDTGYGARPPRRPAHEMTLR